MFYVQNKKSISINDMLQLITKTKSSLTDWTLIRELSRNNLNFLINYKQKHAFFQFMSKIHRINIKSYDYLLSLQ